MFLFPGFQRAKWRCRLESPSLTIKTSWTKIIPGHWIPWHCVGEVFCVRRPKLQTGRIAESCGLGRFAEQYCLLHPAIQKYTHWWIISIKKQQIFTKNWSRFPTTKKTLNKFTLERNNNHTIYIETNALKVPWIETLFFKTFWDLFFKRKVHHRSKVILHFWQTNLRLVALGMFQISYQQFISHMVQDGDSDVCFMAPIEEFDRTTSPPTKSGTENGGTWATSIFGCFAGISVDKLNP